MKSIVPPFLIVLLATALTPSAEARDEYPYLWLEETGAARDARLETDIR